MTHKFQTEVFKYTHNAECGTCSSSLCFDINCWIIKKRSQGNKDMIKVRNFYFADKISWRFEDETGGTGKISWVGQDFFFFGLTVNGPYFGILGNRGNNKRCHSWWLHKWFIPQTCVFRLYTVANWNKKIKKSSFCKCCLVHVSPLLL